MWKRCRVTPSYNGVTRAQASNSHRCPSTTRGTKKAITQAHRRLQETDTGGEHYLLASDFAEALEALDVPRIPAIVVYSAEGERRATLLGDQRDNRIFPEDLKGTLDAMLGGE